MSGSISSERRHGRTRGNRNAFSSKISLVSALTSSSGGSSGSTSTVTQESINRRRARPASKPNGATRRRNRSQSLTESNIPVEHMATKSPLQDKGPIVDVFQYLDTSDSRNVSTISLLKSPLRTPTTQYATFSPFLEEKEEHFVMDDALEKTERLHSFHSDSGISMQDSSSDQSLHATGPGSAISDISEEETGCNVDDVSRSIPEDRSSWSDENPESFYHTGSWAPALPLGDGVRQSARSQPPAPLSQSNRTGYDQLAEALTAEQNETPIPLYRKFEQLNHRVLLKLQDETSELEEILVHLDKAVTSTAPSSQRLDWQSHSNSAFHAQRHDVLNQIQSKLEQYNRALISFQQVQQHGILASTEDIDRYRAWISYHQPVVAAEAQFLSHTADLISLHPHHCHQNILFRRAVEGSSATVSPSAIQTTCLIAAAAIILPLLAFKLIPSYLGRFALLLLVPAVPWIIGVIKRSRAEGGRGNIKSFIVGEELRGDVKVCVLGYLGVMCIAALLVS